MEEIEQMDQEELLLNLLNLDIVLFMVLEIMEAQEITLEQWLLVEAEVLVVLVLLLTQVIMVETVEQVKTWHQIFQEFLYLIQEL